MALVLIFQLLKMYLLIKFMHESKERTAVIINLKHCVPPSFSVQVNCILYLKRALYWEILQEWS